MYLEQKLENLEVMQAHLLLDLKASFKKSGVSNKDRKTTIELAKVFVELFTGEDMRFSANGSVVELEQTVFKLNEPNKKTFSKCKEDDVFNLYIGQAIALARMLELSAVEEFFISAPQPKKNAVGQIITFQVGDEFHREVLYRVDDVERSHGNLTVIYDNTASLARAVENLTGRKANANLKSDHTLVTINDTDAKY